MATRQDLSPLRDLLPELLSRLAKTRGSAFALKLLWETVAGPQLSRACQPERLEGTTLVVRVPSAAWGAELNQLEEKLCQGLSEAGIKGTVQNIRWEVQK